MLMAQGLYNHSTIAVDDDDNPIYWNLHIRKTLEIENYKNTLVRI